MNKSLGIVISVGLFLGYGYYQKRLLAKSDDSIVSFLQDYIRIDTTHPTPNYARAISFLKSHAVKDGFNVTEVSLPSGKPVLIITYQGTDDSLPSLVLNHHMDVVPATAQGWDVGPFEGKIVDGVLIGRGVQDMKGIGAVHYHALKQLKDNSITLKRTVHIFAVPDEEIGGFSGTKQLVETDVFKKLNVGFVIDEGHASGKDGVFDLKVSERKPIQITVFGKGNQAHGSKLHCVNVVHELVEFLYAMTQRHKEQQNQSYNGDHGKFLSFNISSLDAGIRKENGHVALNMVPPSAQATLDIRVPPQINNNQIKKELDQLIAQFPHLAYRIEAEATEERAYIEFETPLYHAMVNTIKRFGISVQPHYFEASSDLRFYHTLGIDGIGLTPFAVQDNIHGINESVPVVQLEKAQELFVQFLHDFCVA